MFLLQALLKEKIKKNWKKIRKYVGKDKIFHDKRNIAKNKIINICATKKEYIIYILKVKHYNF